jgi:hypothetical protein
MRRREWCECEVPGETTTRGLGLKRKEERVRKKRDKKTVREKKKNAAVDYCKQDNANLGQVCSE